MHFFFIAVCALNICMYVKYTLYSQSSLWCLSMRSNVILAVVHFHRPLWFSCQSVRSAFLISAGTLRIISVSLRCSLRLAAGDRSFHPRPLISVQPRALVLTGSRVPRLCLTSQTRRHHAKQKFLQKARCLTACFYHVRLHISLISLFACAWHGC